MERLPDDFAPSCAVDGCSYLARVRPVLVLHFREPGLMAVLSVDYPLCGKCAERTELSDLVDDAAWRTIRREFRRRRDPVPIRELMELRFATIMSEVMQ